MSEDIFYYSRVKLLSNYVGICNVTCTQVNVFFLLYLLHCQAHFD